MNIQDIAIAVWDKLQFGFDIVLPVVSIWLVFKWIRESRRKAEESQRKQLDASVRSVAVSSLQQALQTLSQQYVFGVVQPLNAPANIAGLGLDRVTTHFERNPNSFNEMQENFTRAQEGVRKFIEEIHAWKYQIYPLMDALGNKQLIVQFKSELQSLVDLFNRINTSNIALMQELGGVLKFCAENKFESLDESQTKHLLRISGSIMLDEDYKYWVNTFIPDADEPAYWNEKNEKSHEARAKGVQQFIAHAYQKPNLLSAQVFSITVGRYQNVQTACKRFLVVLAAINHALLSDKVAAKIDELIKEYEGENYFALDSEVR